jgi:hypothetical protein
MNSGDPMTGKDRFWSAVGKRLVPMKTPLVI